jgi:hypothetical protein
VEDSAVLVVSRKTNVQASTSTNQDHSRLA